MDTGLFVLKALLLSMFYILLAFAMWGVGGALVIYLALLGIRKITRSRFWRSLFAYFKLYRAGFSISHYEYSEDYHVNRFYWKGKMIQEMPDIDMVSGHYNTLNNGHVESLS